CAASSASRSRSQRPRTRRCDPSRAAAALACALMPLLGELAGLGCALCWAATTLLVRQEARRANVLLVNAIASTAAAGWMLALALALGLVGRHAVAFGPAPWRGLAFLVLSVVLSLGIG